MKQILFITYTHSNGGGAESLLTSYVNSFDPKKYAITILEIEHFDVKKEPLNNIINLIKMPVYFNDFRRHIFFIYFKYINTYLLKYKPELLRSIFNLQHYDCVITWNYQLPSFMLPAFPDTHRIGMFHGALTDLIDNIENNKIDKNLQDKRELQIKAWNTADEIITISNKSLKSVQEAFPEFVNKVRVINNGIDINYIRQRGKLKNDFILDKSKKYICCCGRLDENKNFQLAIKALAILNKKINNVKLVIIGKGEKLEEYEKLAKELQIFEKVIFAGYQMNPYPIILQCDVFCMTSFSEGFPMVVMEAMCLGKPFVTTRVSGANEELSNNNQCGLVADWDENDYAEKLYTLLTDLTLYNKMKDNCLKHIQNFSLQNSVNKFYKIFDDCELKENKKIKVNHFINKIEYFFFALFYFNKNWFSKKIKTDRIKALVYLIGYIISILFFPIKFFYILVYILIAGL